MSIMSWSTFRCENPDFVVRSVPDNLTFAVNRSAMQKSEVFRDMFSLCKEQSNNAILKDEEEPLDLFETSEMLIILLRLLHYPLLPPVLIPSEELYWNDKLHYDPTTVIPLPILERVIFKLVDKYVLDESIIMETLQLHLIAHAPVHGLRIYGFAIQHDMDKVANKASQYVLPLARYGLDEVKLVPTVEAYHKILLLQDFRVEALRDLVLKEDIFPHGYGKCSTHHEETLASWDNQRKGLLGRIDTRSDVAWEMSTLTESFRACHTCHKACVAAVEMLAYKCRKLPRTLHKLPEGYLSSSKK